jgi:hypothetical protein
MQPPLLLQPANSPAPEDELPEDEEPEDEPDDVLPDGEPEDEPDDVLPGDDPEDEEPELVVVPELLVEPELLVVPELLVLPPSPDPVEPLPPHAAALAAATHTTMENRRLGNRMGHALRHETRATSVPAGTTGTRRALPNEFLLPK